jgi:hypothetical protein
MIENAELQSHGAASPNFFVDRGCYWSVAELASVAIAPPQRRLYLGKLGKAAFSRPMMRRGTQRRTPMG